MDGETWATAAAVEMELVPAVAVAVDLGKAVMEVPQVVLHGPIPILT